MKKVIVSVFALAVATLSIHAQDLPEKKHRSFKGRHHGQVFQQLNLSEEQQTKMKALNEDFRNQVQELKKNEDITVKEQKSRMQALRNDHKAKFQGVLTPDQKAQLENMKKDRRATHEVDAKARMEKMKIRLGLSDDQVAKLERNRTEMSSRLKALRENQSLTADQKKEQVKELMKQRKENLKSVLTAEQLKKMEERKPRRHSNPA